MKHPGLGGALRAVPDQVVVAVGLARPQGRVDRGVEARVVELDRDVGFAIGGGGVPACADLGLMRYTA